MRRIALWFASTATVVTLLFGYHTSTEGVAASGTQQPVVSSSAGGTQAAASTASGSRGGSTRKATRKATPSVPKTYTGDVAQTAYGPVQVAVDVLSGKVTKVSVLQYPNANSVDQQIASYALPQLNREAIAAQSAHID